MPLPIVRLLGGAAVGLVITGAAPAAGQSSRPGADSTGRPRAVSAPKASPETPALPGRDPFQQRTPAPARTPRRTVAVVDEPPAEPPGVVTAILASDEESVVTLRTATEAFIALRPGDRVGAWRLGRVTTDAATFTPASGSGRALTLTINPTPAVRSRTRAVAPATAPASTAPGGPTAAPVMAPALPTTPTPGARGEIPLMPAPRP